MGLQWFAMRRQKRSTWKALCRVCDNVYVYVRVCVRASMLVCVYLCIEEQVLPDCEVVKQHVVLGTEAQAAADQSHVLTDVVTVDVGPAAGGRKQPCKHTHNQSVQIIKAA